MPVSQRGSEGSYLANGTSVGKSGVIPTRGDVGHTKMSSGIKCEPATPGYACTRVMRLSEPILPHHRYFLPPDLMHRRW